jgi:hypothetical protein
MFFSHHGAGVNEQLVRDAGFTIGEAAVVFQDDEDTQFLWVVAHHVTSA